MAAVPAFLLLLAVAVSGQIEVFPPRAVKQVGESLDFLCKVPYPITYCRIEMESGDTYVFTSAVPGKDGEPTYNGRGLEVGECGAHIPNIKEQWNGHIGCTVPPQTGSREIKGAMALTVARAPGVPELRTQPPANQLKEGDRLEAICRVPAGRPPAQIVWTLGDQLIQNGLGRPELQNSSEPGLVDVSQVLNMAVSADDDRKELVCRAEHPANRTRLAEAKAQLNVQYPPRRVDGSSDDHITIFGLKLQEEGRLNVTVRANPRPRVEWTVAGHTLIPSTSQNSHHEEGSIWTALEPLQLPHDSEHGSGFYNITLVLSPVNKEDVDRNYFLKISNDLDSKNLIVQISTLDEPAGVELDGGAIAGIVVGVLIVLIAIFLVVFAKATDRWCFAGSRGRDHTKNSGESTPAGDVLIEGFPLPSRTDTESAVGGRPSRLAGLGARVRAVLPRGKDKVQATEPQADKPLADEKKSVVYAELALGEQTADKPQPPSTEYAEIVYNEQPKETKE